MEYSLNNINFGNKIFEKKEKIEIRSRERKKKYSTYRNENNYDIIDNYLQRDIPTKKSNIKINENDFQIPKFSEYLNIIYFNYNLPQMKRICKHYNLKINGNKEELKKRLYNYLFISKIIIIIQKYFRKCLITRYINLHGPAFFKRDKCTNDVDFCTLDEVEKIPYTQFFSFKDPDNFIYGFDILSIFNLYEKNKSNIENPFNKKTIPKEVIKNFLNFIKLSKILKKKINIDYDKINNFTEKQKTEMKILSLFQIMDSYGHYTNCSWFNKLNKYDLVTYLRELADIWSYRANLTKEIKRDIVSPTGNPFIVDNSIINLYSLNSHSFNQIRKYTINIIENFISKGINDHNKILGSNYVLCALTLVSNEAAEAMPWLYEAVAHN